LSRTSSKSLYIDMRISNRNIRGDSVYHTRCIGPGICG
jgi:hypothetical protein